MNNIDFKQTKMLIQYLRKTEGLSQEAFAKELNVTKACVSTWENTDSSCEGIKIESLYNIARFFNVKVSELLNGKLDSESMADLCQRNFKLPKKPDDEALYYDGGEDELLAYLKKYSTIKKTLYSLSEKIVLSTIDDAEKVEFDFILDQFGIDSSFLEMAGHKNIYSYFSSLSKKYHDCCKGLTFDIGKALSNNCGINVLLVLEFDSKKSSLLYAECMFPWELAEYMATDLNYSEGNNYEITREAMFMKHIGDGANPLFLPSYFNKISNTHDADMVDALKGVLVPDEARNRAYRITRKYSFDDGVIYWKHLTYREYLDSCDADFGNDIRASTALERQNPKEHFEYIAERDSKFLGKRFRNMLTEV